MARLGGMIGQVGRDGWLSLEGWEAKLVAQACYGITLAGFESRRPSKFNWRHKQRSGQHTLARQKILVRKVKWERLPLHRSY